MSSDVRKLRIKKDILNAGVRRPQWGARVVSLARRGRQAAVVPGILRGLCAAFAGSMVQCLTAALARLSDHDTIVP